MVYATLFNWVDVSVACTSTPRLSVNQATACCCAVLIIAHNSVYVLRGGVSRYVLCKLCSEADTMYEQDTRIRLALISREEHYFQCVLHYYYKSHGNHDKARCLVRCLYLDSICCDV